MPSLSLASPANAKATCWPVGVRSGAFFRFSTWKQFVSMCRATNSSSLTPRIFSQPLLASCRLYAAARAGVDRRWAAAPDTAAAWLQPSIDVRKLTHATSALSSVSSEPSGQAPPARAARKGPRKIKCSWPVAKSAQVKVARPLSCNTGKERAQRMLAIFTTYRSGVTLR
jgi:hypothetical protein